MDSMTDNDRLLLLGSTGRSDTYHCDTLSGGEKYTSKSLFFCLSLESPFYNPEHPDQPPPSRGVKIKFFAQPACADNPGCAMQDDDLLITPKEDKDRAPTKFEKVIEIIMRLQARGLTVEPKAMLLPSTDPLAQLDRYPDNEWQGQSICFNALLLSKDQDEMYIKLHAPRDVLLKFAEEQSVALNTHELSFGGGAAIPYSKEMEKKLDESVRLFATAYKDADIKMKDDEGNFVPMDLKSNKNYGFILDVPDKMRLMTRIVREAWRFGGCGIQIAEMKKKGVIVKHFFPLHNKKYAAEYSLDRWCSFKTAVSLHPFYQVENHLVKYFGEEVALYFVWIRKYTLFLRYIAFFGLIAGVLNLLGRYIPSISDLHIFPMSLINMCFSVICVVWGVAWILKWKRIENEFALRHGQDAQVSQELVRDEFEQAGPPTELSIPDVYTMKFEYPLTLRNTPDGGMMKLEDSARIRWLKRYLVSYPIILVLSGAQVTALYYTTYWRFAYPTDKSVSYGSSFCTILIGWLFGWLFDLGIQKLNDFENNRTDTEQTEQSINKSFLFYFFSYYFALFTIAMWPSDMPDDDRLDQLASQMLVICLIKPMIQNFFELFLPYFKSELRIRGDMHEGSTCAALISFITREVIPDNDSMTSSRERDARHLWLEAQKEPYDSTSGDYLEVTLQFGYMTMFAATFPWAAVLAYLYNILEIRIDARKLMHEFQRPLARPAKSIGSWNGIYLFLSAVSVVTNGFLIAVMSPAPEKMGLPAGTDARYKIFAVAQYIFVACFFINYAWFSGDSANFHKLKAKHHILGNRSTRDRFATLMANEITAREQGRPVA